MNEIDTLVHARWVIPVEPHHTVLENHSIAIHNGQILAILPTTEAMHEYEAHHVLTLTTHALIPGLINTHTHSPMTLFRGFADDLALMTWLNDHIWPAEGKWVGEEFVQDGTEIAVAEMLRSGTTCFNDSYFFPHITAQVAAKAGIRAHVGQVVIQVPTRWASTPDEYINKGLAIIEQYAGHPLIKTTLAPHSPYGLNDPGLKRVLEVAEQYNLQVHMHVHEAQDEITDGLTRTGIRPLARLDNLGLLSPRLIAVHMICIDESEFELIKKRGVNVVHCPESNLKIASGFAPVKRFWDQGTNVALGTDGAASNNDLDMIGEMRTAAMLAKAVSNNAAAMNAHEVLQMATLNGAKALTIDNMTGSLVVGKAADIVAIDLERLETQPVTDPVSQIIYSSSREQVTHVWVNGELLLDNRNLTRFELPELIQKAQHWHKRLTHG